MVGLTTAFVVFRPVQVVPRIAAGPDYQLIDQRGEAVGSQKLAGSIVLYGFGYTYDATGGIEQTIEDMRAFQAQAASIEAPIQITLILFDDVRDTVTRRQEFAAFHQLDLATWLLLSGPPDELKRTIGQGFGVYYEAVPLEDLPDAASLLSTDGINEYGYLQAERYVLVDTANIIRAEYRPPFPMDTAIRDVNLIIREKNSTGAQHTLNEAAHLFLCYPK
jgi:protein SCO1/2